MIIGAPPGWTQRLRRIRCSDAGDRANRIAAVNRMLDRRRIQLSDWQGQSYVLRSMTGQQAIVSNVTEVWAALEKEFGGGFDPLDEANFPDRSAVS
ncbi:hypothetical protein [Phaeobacter sp. J2-8]|uniref:hypothetical protein n=1 Tax=Phaeobacter sp. J2-8 TaxID=2931394 RepID=UPI001FD43B84|nr:hypothetical protein [Phaeobacter sp. J2-8]MCJ7872149.1 hypothetical protein [Phaeobacter sp. J2-8]